MRLSKNSSNSNNPPSTDRFERKNAPKSEREKSVKKTGGRAGVTLQPVEQPNEIIDQDDVAQCYPCQHDLFSTLSTYLHLGKLIPLKRVKLIFQPFFSLSLSEGTLVNMHEKIYTQLEATEDQIRNV